MSLTQTEIETIVRRVLSTLTGDGLRPSESKSPESAAKLISNDDPQTLFVSDSVISAATLKDRLSNVRTVRLNRHAVITPAAVDICKQAEIRIVRDADSEILNATASQPRSTRASTTEQLPRLIVSGSCPALLSIAKQLCPKQAHVTDSMHDDTAALQMIRNGLHTGHKAGIAIVSAPHATCWQAARDDKLRPAVVSQWSELESVLAEVPVNVLILSASRWNVPSICNASRRFHEHIQRQS